MAQIIITIPDAKRLEGEALEAALEMVEQVAEDLHNGFTSGHIDPQRHWTFEADQPPNNYLPARTFDVEDANGCDAWVTVGAWVDDDGVPVVQVDTAGDPVFRVSVNSETGNGPDPSVVYGPAYVDPESVR